MYVIKAFNFFIEYRKEIYYYAPVLDASVVYNKSVNFGFVVQEIRPTFAVVKELTNSHLCNNGISLQSI